jgi:phage terminase large subunit-like protein
MTYTIEEFTRRELELVEQGARMIGPSLMQRVARMRGPARDELLGSLGVLDSARLLYEWEAWARPKQLAPIGIWTVWLALGGRGLGKTRIGTEWIRDRVESGRARSIAVIGPDWKDVRRYQIGGHKGQGGSGLLDVFPPWNKPEWKEDKAEVHWPNGAMAVVQSAERPEFRGANLDTIWADEPIKWRYAEALWDNIEMVLREPGAAPQMCITTTPMPMQLLRDLIMDPGTVVTHGTSWENEANLAPQWIERMRRRYEGTRIGQQELGARILGDNPDALFHMSIIEATRKATAPELMRTLVGVDPAVSQHRKSDATGIVVAGADRDLHCYVLGDGTAKLSPDGWAKVTVDLAIAHKADGFVVERNKVGDLAKHTIQSELRNRRLVGEYDIFEAYSSEDKPARAAPVSALYEHGRVHHVGRGMRELENEITSWQPKHGRSPNRLDALVHAIYVLTHLADDEQVDPDKLYAGYAQLNRGFSRGGASRRVL